MSLAIIVGVLVAYPACIELCVTACCACAVENIPSITYPKDEMLEDGIACSNFFELEAGCAQDIGMTPDDLMMLPVGILEFDGLIDFLVSICVNTEGEGGARCELGQIADAHAVLTHPFRPVEVLMRYLRPGVDGSHVLADHTDGCASCMEGLDRVKLSFE